jgi:hypothetical protein
MEDFTEIAEIIESARLPDWDKEFVAAAVDAAYKKWWVADSNLAILGVEMAGKEPVPHKIDVVTQDPATSLYKVIDWKTKAAGKLDDRWVEKESRSPQRNLYAAALRNLFGPHVFPLRYEVRGVTMEEKPQCKVISFVIQESGTAAALVNIRGVQAVKNELIAREIIPWPRNEAGCRMYGPNYACEFENICWHGAPLPEGNPSTRALSHSSRQEFLRCPERARLLEVTKNWDAEEDAEDNKGDIFHKCMERLYKTRLIGE